MHAAVVPSVPSVVERRGPACWVKTVVSLLVLLHGFAIVTAVTAAGNNSFPPPSILVLAKDWITRPYLQLVFLTNPYRFYAPNPGPTPVLWFRLTYEDGSTLWLELPRRENWSIRMPYQRHLCAVMLFDQMAYSVSNDDPGMRRLSAEGRIAACSYVRYVARKFGRTNADGSPNPVREIAFYNIMHQIMEPWQVRDRWKTTDLRLHMPFYVGTFGRDGALLDTGTTSLEYRQMSDLAAHMLTRDIYPVFKAHPDTDRALLLDEIGAPPAIRALFYDFPELLKGHELEHVNLKDKLEQLHGLNAVPAATP